VTVSRDLHRGGTRRVPSSAFERLPINIDSSGYPLGRHYLASDSNTMPYILNDSDLETLLSYLHSCGHSLPPDIARIHWELIFYHALTNNLPLPEGGPVRESTLNMHDSYLNRLLLCRRILILAT
jgi:hypothetical protein